MTHDTLRALVRDDATGAEPPFSLSPDAALARGRGRLRARRLAVGAACLAVLATGAAVVPRLTGSDDVTRAGGSELDAATQRALDTYDASRMGATLDDAVRTEVERVAPPFGSGTVRAYDSQGQTLPPRYLDRASGWRGDYAWGLDHTFSVDLLYAMSEAEGDPDEYCSSSLAEGYDLTCTVGRTDGGQPVITSVAPLRVETDEGTAGGPTRYAVTDWRRVDPGKLWFVRSVEVRRGGAYVTTASESVHARTPQAAAQQWNVDADVMARLASEPALVFPEPAKDENGCDFTLPGTGYSCTESVPMEPGDG